MGTPRSVNAGTQHDLLSPASFTLGEDRRQAVSPQSLDITLPHGEVAISTEDHAHLTDNGNNPKLRMFVVVFRHGSPKLGLIDQPTRIASNDSRVVVEVSWWDEDVQQRLTVSRKTMYLSMFHVVDADRLQGLIQVSVAAPIRLSDFQIGEVVIGSEDLKKLEAGQGPAHCLEMWVIVLRPRGSSMGFVRDTPPRPSKSSPGATVVNCSWYVEDADGRITVSSKGMFLHLFRPVLEEVLMKLIQGLQPLAPPEQAVPIAMGAPVSTIVATVPQDSNNSVAPLVWGRLCMLSEASNAIPIRGDPVSPVPVVQGVAVVGYDAQDVAHQQSSTSSRRGRSGRVLKCAIS